MRRALSFCYQTYLPISKEVIEDSDEGGYEGAGREPRARGSEKRFLSGSPTRFVKKTEDLQKER